MTELLRYDMFLSHNRADESAVEVIARRLRAEAGLNPFLDTWHLVPGEPWQEGLERALNTSRSCALFLGPKGLGTWDNEAMRTALDIRAEIPDFYIIPILLPGAALPERGKLPHFLARLEWVDFRAGLDGQQAFHALVNGIRGLSYGHDSATDLDAICPFRGLEMFEEEHAAFFFGREALTQHLVEHLRSDRFLAVLGSSGSGKSSLVRAALIPQLRAGVYPDSNQWMIVVCKPGTQPLGALAARILPHLNERTDSLVAYQSLLETLQRSERGLHTVVQIALGGFSDQQRVVIVVDQFEEVFTLSHDEREREQFIANLLYAASIPGGQTIIVLTMRADFLWKCTSYIDLAARLKGLELIEHMDAQDLRRAMLGPAEKVGLRYEKGLLERLLADVGDAPGGLPLLQHTLLELWERRRNSWMTIDAYQAIGGVQGALAQRAETVYARLTAAQQLVARRLLLRLTEPGQGTEDTRRSAPLSELLAVSDSPTDVQTVVATLVDARLLTTSKDQHTTVVVDVAHEALIRGWPRLRTWIDEDRTALRVHRQLTEAAAAWEQAGHDTGYLYRGARLLETQVWAETHSGDLNALEQRFVTASIAEREAEQRAVQRRVRQTIGGLVGALLVVSLVAALAVWFWQAADVATQQMALESERAASNAATAQAERGRALSSQATAEAESQRASVAERQARARLLVEQGRRVFAAEGKLLLGLRLAVEGLALVAEDETQTQAALRDVVLEMAHSGRVVQLGSDVRAIYAVPNDPTLLVVDHKQGVAELRRADDGQLLTLLSDQFTAVWPMTGTLFLVSYATDPAEIRRTTDGSLVMSLASPVSYVEYNPDSSAMIVSYQTARSEVRRTSDGGLIIQLPNRVESFGISFSPASTVAVIRYQDAPSELRRTSDWELITTLSGQINSVDFSPDSRTMLTRYSDAQDELRRVADGGLITAFADRIDYQQAYFSPDFTTVAITYQDKQGELRRTYDGALLARLSDQIDEVEFSPNSTTVVIRYKDERGELRRVVDGGLIIAFANHLDIGGAYFSPDSTVVIIGYNDAQSELRHTSDGSLITQLSGHVQLFQVYFSPDYANFVIGYEGAEGELRRTRDGRLITTLTEGIRRGVIFKQTKTTSVFLVQYGNKEGELRRTTDGTLVRRLPAVPLTIYFSHEPDINSFLVIYESSRASEIRRLDDGSLITTLSGPVSHGDERHGSVISFYEGFQVGFSAPEDRTIFTADYNDRSSEIWNWEPNARRLARLGFGVNQNVVVAKSTRQAVVYTDGHAYLFDISWLQRLTADSSVGSSSASLIHLLCEGPFVHWPWSDQDQAVFNNALDNKEPQACKETP